MIELSTDAATQSAPRFKIVRLSCDHCDLDATPSIPPLVYRDYLEGEWLHECDPESPGRLLFALEPEGMTIDTLAALMDGLKVGRVSFGFSSEVMQLIRAPSTDQGLLNKALLA